MSRKPGRNAQKYVGPSNHSARFAKLHQTNRFDSRFWVRPFVAPVDLHPADRRHHVILQESSKNGRWLADSLHMANQNRPGHIEDLLEITGNQSISPGPRLKLAIFHRARIK